MKSWYLVRVLVSAVPWGRHRRHSSASFQRQSQRAWPPVPPAAPVPLLAPTQDTVTETRPDLKTQKCNATESERHSMSLFHPGKKDEKATENGPGNICRNAHKQVFVFRLISVYDKTSD